MVSIDAGQIVGCIVFLKGVISPYSPSESSSSCNVASKHIRMMPSWSNSFQCTERSSPGSGRKSGTVSAMAC